MEKTLKKIEKKTKIAATKGLEPQLSLNKYSKAGTKEPQGEERSKVKRF